MDCKNNFRNNLVHHMNCCGVDRKTLAKSLDIPYSSLTDWINGNSFPRMDKIERLASYFNVSPAELIGSQEQCKSQLKAFEDFMIGIPSFTFNPKCDEELLYAIRKYILKSAQGMSYAHVDLFSKFFVEQIKQSCIVHGKAMFLEEQP